MFSLIVLYRGLRFQSNGSVGVNEIGVGSARMGFCWVAACCLDVSLEASDGEQVKEAYAFRARFFGPLRKSAGSEE